MVNKISAPYNFVPLNEFVFVPDWGGEVSQDIPFADGEDGYIEVTWKNVSPLCIRDASGTDDKKYYSMHVKMSDGSRLYFIPGSSLRGMLRNTLSVMSFGRLSQYDNKCYEKKKKKGTQDTRKFCVEDLIGRCQTKTKPFENDLVDVMFGWVDDNGSMKGRVQIGNAFSSHALADEELCAEVHGVLGAPKPSYFPLYLQQDKNPYKDYSSENATISGTKRYRIHKGDSVMCLPQINENENVESRFRPVPAGQTFKMRIVVHNMRKMEIGALLSAITFNHTPGTYHNIGSAKGFGYGKMECADLSLHGFAFSEEEYLKEFEYVMSQFTKAKYSCLWSETTQVKSLVAIMSEHEDNDVRMMEMDKNRSPLQKNEYEYYKTNFSKLEETDRSVTTYLDVDAFKLKRFRGGNAETYDKVREAENAGDYKTAVHIIEGLIKEMLIMRLDKSDEEAWKENLINKQNAEDEAEAQKRKEEAEEKKKEVLSGGLAVFIEEKNPLTDKYKVDKWKTCDSKIKQWLKKKNTSSLDDDEKQTLEKTIRRLHVEQDRSEKKDWKVEYDKNKIWKAIRGYLGEERAMSLYKSMEG